MSLFCYFQKAPKFVTEHQEISNDQNSNTGLNRVESESAAEMLKHATTGK